MTPAQMNLAIAKACGWSVYKHWQPSGDYFFVISSPKGNLYQDWVTADADVALSNVCPIYSDNLDACFEMEGVLTSNKEKLKYIQSLRRVIFSPDDYANKSFINSLHGFYWLIQAPAHAKCEAFLRAKGLWVD